MGFIVAPGSLIEYWASAKYGIGNAVAPQQAALAQFIDAGHLRGHLRRMQRRYTARRASLLAGIDR